MDLATKVDYGLTASASVTDDGPRFLRITDIQNGQVRWEGVPSCECSGAEQAKYRLEASDIVFARTGATTGKSYLINDCPNGAVFASYLIRVRPNGHVVPAYLAYFFQSPDYWRQVRAGSTGSAQPGVNATKLKSLVVPLAPLAEQQCIVSILDEAFEAIDTAIANTEKNLANARDLFAARRDGVLENSESGWREARLSELATIKHGFAFKSEFFAEQGEHVLLTPGNFYESGGYRDRGGKQKYYVGDIPEGFILAEGDFLVAMTEQAPGLLGSPIIVPQADRFLHNQRLGLVLPVAGAVWCNRFFFHVFNTRRFRRLVHKDATGLKVRHTSPTKLGAVRVRFPADACSQEKVADQLDDLEQTTRQLEVIYTQKAKALAELKQSILCRAFAGELSVSSEQVVREARA